MCLYRPVKLYKQSLRGRESKKKITRKTMTSSIWRKTRRRFHFCGCTSCQRLSKTKAKKREEKKPSHLHVSLYLKSSQRYINSDTKIILALRIVRGNQIFDQLCRLRFLSRGTIFFGTCAKSNNRSCQNARTLLFFIIIVKLELYS